MRRPPSSRLLPPSSLDAETPATIYATSITHTHAVAPTTLIAATTTNLPAPRRPGTVFSEILSAAAANPHADLLLISEGLRHDGITYVHGGLLVVRQTPLARAFVRTWLRRYLVEYKAAVEVWERWAPVYEQPALTEVTEATIAALDPAAVHFLPAALLARPHTGQLALFRRRVQLGEPAAPLVHINPLKDRQIARQLVMARGCLPRTKGAPQAKAHAKAQAKALSTHGARDGSNVKSG